MCWFAVAAFGAGGVALGCTVVAAFGAGGVALGCTVVAAVGAGGVAFVVAVSGAGGVALGCSVVAALGAGCVGLVCSVVAAVGAGGAGLGCAVVGAFACSASWCGCSSCLLLFEASASEGSASISNSLSKASSKAKASVEGCPCDAAFACSTFSGSAACFVDAPSWPPGKDCFGTGAVDGVAFGAATEAREGVATGFAAVSVRMFLSAASATSGSAAVAVALAGGGVNPAHDFATASGALLGATDGSFFTIVVGLGGGAERGVEVRMFSALILMKLPVFALLAGLSLLFGFWCSLFTGTDFAAVGTTAGLFAFFVA